MSNRSTPHRSPNADGCVDPGGDDSDVLPLVGLPEPLRIVGTDGFALVLTPVPVLVEGPEWAQLDSGFDVELIDPDRYLVFRNRRCSPQESVLLAEFLKHVLTSTTRADFRSHLGGFELSIIAAPSVAADGACTVSSTDIIVRVEVTDLSGLGGWEPVRFVFQATRVACWGAAQAAERNVIA